MVKDSKASGLFYHDKQLEEERQSRASVDKWIFLLLVVVIAITPLIVLAFMKEVQSPVISNVSLLNSGEMGELFTAYKARFVYVLTAVIAGLFLFRTFFMGGTLRKTPINYFVGLFVIAIIISTLLSDSISTAFSGIYNRSDGALSWICYVTLLFVAMNIDYPKKAVQYILYSLMPFVFINLVVITMNFYGKDLLQNYQFVQSLVQLTLPEGAELGEGSQLVGTLNQWNYMSGMFAVMTVMYVAATIVSKSWVQRIIFLVTALASIATMLQALSTSGFLTVTVSLLFLIVLVLRAENKVHGAIMLGTFLIVTAPIFHILAEKDARIWKESFGFVIDHNPYIEPVPVEPVPTEPVLEEPVSKAIFIPAFGTVAYAAEQSFELPVLPERAIAAGSGRAYIWSKAFESLEGTDLLVGKGLDTILYFFPHYDLEARAGMWDESTIVDKPHSLYIGVLYGTGILGLVALLGIIVMTIWQAIPLVKQNKLTIVILVVAWFAFLIQAVFNDSLVGMTAPLFAIVGIFIGLTMNEKGELQQRE